MVGRVAINRSYDPLSLSSHKLISKHSEALSLWNAFIRVPHFSNRPVCLATVLVVWAILFTMTVPVFGAERLMLNEKLQHTYLTPYIDVLDDPDHQWTIQDVVKPPLYNQFKAMGQETAVNRGLTRSVLWLRFTMIDQTKGDFTGFVLDFNRPPVLDIELYTPDPTSPEGYTVQRTGDNEGDIKSAPQRVLFFPLPIEKNKPATCYLRVSSNYTPLFLPITVHGKAAHQSIEVARMYWLGANLGISVAVILFNFFIFLSLKDKSYLYYVLYASAWTLYCLEFTGIAGRYLIPYVPDLIRFGDLSHRFSYISLGLGILFAGLFARSFLMTQKQSPITDKSLKLVAGLAVSMVLLGFFMDNLWLNKIAGVVGLLTPIVFMTAGLRVWYLGFKPARFFVLAWTILLTSGFIYALAFMGVFPLSLSLFKFYQSGQSLELLLLSFALADRIKTMHEERESMKRRERRLLELSVTDGLTGLYNRRFLLSKLSSEFNHSKRLHHPLSLFMIDLDDFKQYNDRFGHPEGDKVLTALAEVIRSNIRETDCACRYGGEEFTVILPEVNKVTAAVVADRIRKGFGSHAFRPNGSVGIHKTISIGLAELSDDDENEMSLIQRADQALYRAKYQGKDQIVVCNGYLNPQT